MRFGWREWSWTIAGFGLGILGIVFGEGPQKLGGAFFLFLAILTFFAAIWSTWRVKRGLAPSPLEGKVLFSEIGKKPRIPPDEVPESAFDGLEEFVAFFKQLGFFPRYDGQPVEEQLDDARERWRVSVERSIRSNNGRYTPGERLRSGDYFDDLISLDVLDFDGVLWNDLECDVCNGNEEYLRWMAEWSRISRGAFDPMVIDEKWDGDNGPVRVTIIHNGVAHEINPVYNDDWIDPWVSTQISYLIADTPLRIWHFEPNDQTGQFIALRPEEKERLEAERGWRFLEPEDDFGHRKEIHAAEGYDTFLKAVKANERIVRMRAAELVEALAEGEKRHLIDAAAHPDPLMRRSAVAAVCLSQPVASEELIEIAVRLLGDSDPYVRSSAALAASVLGPNALESLANTAENGSAAARAAAAWAIGKMGTQATRCTELLVFNLRHDDALVRLCAAWALGRISGDAHRVVPQLRNALTDSDWRVRMCAARALGEFGNDASTSVGDLSIALRDAERDEVIVASAKALGAIAADPARVLPALIDVSKTPRDPVCRACIEAIGAFGRDAKQAVPFLIDAVERKAGASFMAEVWAMEALENIGPDAEAAIPALERMLDSFMGEPAARRALDAIRGGAGSSA